MKNKIRIKKLISIFLTVLMMLSVLNLGAFSLNTYVEGTIEGTTGTGVKEDPVLVDTYTELVRALENELIEHVSVTANISCEYDYVSNILDYIIEVAGRKTLYLNGNKIYFSIPYKHGYFSSMTMINLKNASLSIYGDGGTIEYSNLDLPVYESGAPRLLEVNNIDAELLIDGTNIISVGIGIDVALHKRLILQNNTSIYGAHIGLNVRIEKNESVTELSDATITTYTHEHCWSLRILSPKEKSVIGDGKGQSKVKIGQLKLRGSFVLPDEIGQQIDFTISANNPEKTYNVVYYKYSGAVESNLGAYYWDYKAGNSENSRIIINEKKSYPVEIYNGAIGAYGTVAPEGEQFVGNEVVITPDEIPGKKFVRFETEPKLLEIGINGKDEYYFFMPSYPVKINCVFSDVINDVNVTVDTPKLGEKITNTISSTDGDIYKNLEVWWKEKGPNKSDFSTVNYSENPYFMPNYEYKPIVSITPDDLHVFGSDVNVTINGVKGDNLTVTDDYVKSSRLFNPMVGNIIERVDLTLNNYHAGSKVSDIEIVSNEPSKYKVQIEKVHTVNDDTPLEATHELGTIKDSYVIDYIITPVNQNDVFITDISAVYINDRNVAHSIVSKSPKFIKLSVAKILNRVEWEEIDVSIPKEVYMPKLNSIIPSREERTDIVVSKGGPIPKYNIFWEKYNEQTNKWDEFQSGNYETGIYRSKLYVQPTEYKWQNYTNDCVLKINGIKYAKYNWHSDDNAVAIFLSDEFVIGIDDLYETEPVTEDTVRIVKYNGNETNVKIPSVINGKYCTEITGKGNVGAFENNQAIESITVNSHIIKIDNAFENCPNLQNIELQNGIEVIQNKAFAGCKITKIYLPQSLKDISPNSLDCPNLERINVDLNNKNFSSLNSILIKILPNDKSTIHRYPMGNRNKEFSTFRVDEISDGAFKGNPYLETVIFNEYVKKVGNNAFDGCTALKNIKLNEGLQIIGNNSFPENSTVRLPESVLTVGGNENLINYLIHKYSPVDDSDIINNCMYGMYSYLGDLDGDDLLKSNDFAMIKAVSSGGATLTPEQVILADMNGDGTIDGFDAIALSVREYNNVRDKNYIFDVNFDFTEPPSAITETSQLEIATTSTNYTVKFTNLYDVSSTESFGKPQNNIIFAQDHVYCLTYEITANTGWTFYYDFTKDNVKIGFKRGNEFKDGPYKSFEIKNIKDNKIVLDVYMMFPSNTVHSPINMPDIIAKIDQSDMVEINTGKILVYNPTGPMESYTSFEIYIDGKNVDSNKYAYGGLLNFDASKVVKGEHTAYIVYIIEGHNIRSKDFKLTIN